MAKIRNDVLDQLAGEVLPERAVLSAVPMDGGAPFSPFCSPNNQPSTINDNHWADVVNNPQCGLTNHGDNYAGGGLLGGLLRG